MTSGGSNFSLSTVEAMKSMASGKDGANALVQVNDVLLFNVCWFLTLSH